ncbi:MAG: HupE/UreJ family protein, partial [Phenylobacterium sp.]|uniref:HupE/UreJ family protein n=1 Tax=Phenylobacterium sp. TaxID=1871053 RepID=UPI00273520CF
MRRIAILSIVLALAASPALAHPGHGETGLTAGLLHPVTGLDHLLTMLLVGLWAGLAGNQARWLWPAAFTGAMLTGFGLGLTSAPSPGVEGVILASLAMAGLAVGFNLKPPAVLGAAAIGAFALAHGWAHAQETPSGAGLIDFAVGFGAATMALHLAGLGLAALALRAGGGRMARIGGFAAAG